MWKCAHKTLPIYARKTQYSSHEGTNMGDTRPQWDMLSDDVYSWVNAVFIVIGNKQFNESFFYLSLKSFSWECCKNIFAFKFIFYEQTISTIRQHWRFIKSSYMLHDLLHSHMYVYIYNDGKYRYMYISPGNVSFLCSHPKCFLRCRKYLVSPYPVIATLNISN